MTRAPLLAGYVAVLLGPLLMMQAVTKAGDGSPAVVFADALGFAALSLLALQVVTSGRWPVTTRPFGLRAVLSLHRQAGIAVLALVVAHVAGVVLDDPSRLALVAIAATSAGRRRMGLRYERWRALHLALTAVAMAGAFVHVMWVDAYTSAPAVRWGVLGLVLAAAAALFWVRVARPYASALRPYRVEAVRRERGGAVTLELTAVGHPGLRFAPGQFARVRAGTSVYGMDDHPFSLSSGAGRPDRPAFTVKALGDFSAAIADVPVGSRLLVDGPHGEAVRDAPGVRGVLLVAAGIGITPALSVLRTAVERGDRRPMLLLYGSRRWEDVTFREALRALEGRLPGLRVVHVLSRPGPGWGGERGRVDAGLILRHAPADLRRWTALVCGPAAMVADASAALRRLGVLPSRIQAEGFG